MIARNNAVHVRQHIMEMKVYIKYNVNYQFCVLQFSKQKIQKRPSREIQKSRIK